MLVNRSIAKMHQETLSIDGLIDRLLSAFNITDATIKTRSLDQLILIVNNVFPGLTVDIKYIVDRIEKLKRFKKKLEYLKTIPIVVQKSQEWYDLRKKITTASDLAQAFGDGKFGSQKQFYQKKCGYEVEVFNPHVPPLKWGCMFEQTASDIYSQRNGVMITDFGLLQHPDVEYFGASPDGITENGIMLEIKCPFKRKITGEIPLQYYYQIQGQLDVCKLDECDYLECEFGEFASVDDFVEFVGTDDPYQKKQETGIIIEYNKRATQKDTPFYIYSSICHNKKDRDEVVAWCNIQECNLETQGYDIIIPHFWYLRKLNVVRVYKNESFIREKLEGLCEIWENVAKYKADKELYMKNVGSTSATNKRQLDQVKLTGYSFI